MEDVGEDVDTEAVEKAVHRAKIRLQSRSPFFGTLCYFAEFRVTTEVPTAATNGKNVEVNPWFADQLNPAQLDALLLHEVLHAALLHVKRRGARDPYQWNVAADIVVNGIIDKQEGLELPPGPMRSSDLEDKRVEEIYMLLDDPEYEHLRELAEKWRDLLEGEGDLESEWRNALRQAKAAQQMGGKGQGSLPAGLKRHIDSVTEPQIDWRKALWRFMVKTPTDFKGFDRRFIHRGLYLEKLETETLTVYAAVDTSGSISTEQMEDFLGEVQGILRSYPHVECELYYADADLYGPHTLNSHGSPPSIPSPEGGGGTSFVPFFNEVGDKMNLTGGRVCVYLTDGYGDFPEPPPSMPVLWVVVPGGLASEEFPFGRVIRLVE